jgi:hypothetical protein
MIEVKTLPPITHRRAVELHVMPCVLVALWTRPCVVGYPKGAAVGQLAGLRPSRPLWPWAAVKPEGIVDFSIFPWNYSNRFQIKFGLELNSFQFCLNL